MYEALSRGARGVTTGKRGAQKREALFLQALLPCFRLFRTLWFCIWSISKIFENLLSAVGHAVHCPRRMLFAQLRYSLIPELPFCTSIAGPHSQTKEMSHDWTKWIRVFPPYFASNRGWCCQTIQVLSSRYKRDRSFLGLFCDRFSPLVQRGNCKEGTWSCPSGVGCITRGWHVSAGRVILLTWGQSEEEQLRAMTSLVLQWTLIQLASDFVFIYLFIF